MYGAVSLERPRFPWLTEGSECLDLNQINAELSALGCALMRYVESHKPVHRRLFYDPFAAVFLSEPYLRRYRAMETRGQPSGSWLLWLGALREKFFDDLIVKALQQEVRQIVLLGAGYDSRPLRMVELLSSAIAVFEIDQPFMVEKKKKKLRPHLNPLPEHLRFVGMDFHQEGLETLLDAGFDPALKTLFVAQALSYYLEPFAMEGFFEFIVTSCQRPAQLIFDYVDPATMYERGGGGSSWGGVAHGSAFCAEPDVLKTFLRELGYGRVFTDTMRSIENWYTGVITLPVNGWHVASCTTS